MLGWDRDETNQRAVVGARRRNAYGAIARSPSSTRRSRYLNQENRAVSHSDFESIDFFRAGPLYQDPYPYYEYLREHGPVWREPHHGVVMVTGYEEAIQVYHDADTFSNCVAVAGPFARWPVPLEGDDVSDVIEQYRDRLPFSDQLPTFDPPKHTAHRGLLGRLITPKRLKENEEFMWQLADRQIDEFIGRGECEFIHDYAGPFTLLVVADLLGVPESEHETFRKELQGDQKPKQTRDKDGAVAHKPLEFLYERFTKYIEDRRREPRSDVMTGLATATFPDGSLPDVHDIMLIASNLFAAGGETTARLLGVMLRVIAERPDLQQQLRERRDLLPNFIEECVRFETPLQSTFRLSRRATKIGDVEIPAGTTVMLIPAAGNRDPRKFEDPNEFRLGRANWRQHLAFGSGVHACAGAPLARAEGRVSAERLLDRLLDIRISEEKHGPAGARRYEFPATYMLRGVERLHLEFTPAR
jgi:cytochrome P450